MEKILYNRLQESRIWIPSQTGEKGKGTAAFTV